MRIARVSLFLLLGCTVSLGAQTFEQMTFIRPVDASASVRAAAMGATSGDDIAANPAALADVKGPLFSFAAARTEYRLTEIDFIDETTIGLVRHSADQTALSHALAAVPVGGFVVSAYYRANPALSSEQGFGGEGTEPYVPAPCTVICGGYFITASPFKHRDVRYGAAGAWERGAIAIGAGAELQELDERVDFTSIRTFSNDIPSSTFDRVVRRNSGRKIVPNASIRWRFAPRSALTAAYNGAGTFEATNSACTLADPGTRDCTSVLATLSSSKQRMPDAYRLALSTGLTERLQFVTEAVRRNYSNLTEEPEYGVNIPFAAPFRDVTEVHIGAEYRLPRVALRAGWWTDPSHIANGYLPSYGFANTEDHLTVGAGIDVGQARIDLAYDNTNDPGLRRASIGVSFGAPSLRGR